MAQLHITLSTEILQELFLTGNREILGFRVADSETEQSWSEFFNSLKKRGYSRSV